MRVDDGKQGKPVERVERSRRSEPASEHRQSATPFGLDPYGANVRDQEQQHTPRRRVSDTVDLLGVSSDSFAPEAQSAVIALLEEFDRLKHELESTKGRVEELEAMASEDPLVPLLNRRGFLREFNRAISYARRYGTDVSVLFIDLNKFKAINDSYGHAAGDAALKVAAMIIQENVRESDITGRIGGDEFAVALLNAPGEQAKAKADTLATALKAARIPVESGVVSLSAAIGAVQVGSEETGEGALARADAQMYAAKNSVPEEPGAL